MIILTGNTRREKVRELLELAKANPKPVEPKATELIDLIWSLINEGERDLAVLFAKSLVSSDLKKIADPISNDRLREIAQRFREGAFSTSWMKRFHQDKPLAEIMAVIAWGEFKSGVSKQS